MRLVSTRVESGSGGVRLVGVIGREAAPKRAEVYFAFEGEYSRFVEDSADPFLPALLVPCLKAGEDLELLPPVSRRLLQRVDRIQEILVAWYPMLRKVRVTARPREENTRPRPPGVGAFFSGGIDSFYTALKSLRGPHPEVPSISHLIFVNGFDVALEGCTGAEDARRHLESIALRIGIPLIPGETNLRSEFPIWSRYYHGAILAASALALSGGLGHALVPSSNSYAQRRAWGSDPLLDPLWSTERLELVHDGAEARRAEKLASVLAWDSVVLGCLRVCNKNAGGAHNCGRCQKCVRTMTALELLGVLFGSNTFPDRLPADAEARLREEAHEMEEEIEDLLDLAAHTGRRPDLLRMLERVLRRQRRRRALRTLIEETPLLAPAVPWIDRLRRSLRRG